MWKKRKENTYFKMLNLKVLTMIKPSFPAKKCVAWVRKNLISERLKNNKTIVSKYCALILNTKGWLHFKDNDEFAEEALEELDLFYEKPLKSSGFNGSISNLLQQWHLLFEYVLTYFSPGVNLYHILWHKIFESSKCKEWSLVLYVVELLFVLPVSNAKVERLVSFMNRIKTDSQNLLKQEHLSNLLKICMEGPDLQDFNPIPAMQLWNDACKLQRPNQKKRKEYGKGARKATGLLTLVDMESSSESKCEWTNTELLLVIVFFKIVSLKEQFAWIFTSFFFFLEFAQIS